MPRVAIDGVRVVPEQVKIVPPKEKKKKEPPSAQENEKHQRMTVMLLNDMIQTLTQVNHALQHRIDKEHTHLLDLEHEVTILRRYVVNKDKIKN
jgi:predicted RNase H-like nuclease (RuvC/YqgF family)